MNGVKPSEIEIGTCLIGRKQPTWLRRVIGVSPWGTGAFCYDLWDIERGEAFGGIGFCATATLANWAARLATPEEIAKCPMRPPPAYMAEPLSEGEKIFIESYYGLKRPKR